MEGDPVEDVAGIAEEERLTVQDHHQNTIGHCQEFPRI